MLTLSFHIHILESFGVRYLYMLHMLWHVYVYHSLHSKTAVYEDNVMYDAELQLLLTNTSYM